MGSLVTQQRCESRLYPQPKQVLDLASPEQCKAELTDQLVFEPATCQSQVQRPTSDVAHSVVCVSVCVLDKRVSCEKMAEPIEMPLRGLTCVFQRTMC